VGSKSFNIGTVRLLKEMVPKEYWKEMRKWIKKNLADLKDTHAIGSGGNINKIFRLSRKQEGKPITFKELNNIYTFLNSYSLEERIKVLGLRPDRADVIIPASKIYLTVMKQGKIKKTYVPQIGLADGLIHILYERHKNKKTKTS